MIVGQAQRDLESAYETIEKLLEENELLKISKGIQLGAIARKKQIDKGRTALHDMQLYHSGELVNAALFLLTGAASYYPRTWDKGYQYDFGKKKVVEMLSDAIALLAAEIDRLDEKDSQPF
jgi:hypothetical protein